MLPPGARKLALTLSTSSEHSYSYYRCNVRDAAGRSVQSAIVPGPAPGDELHLLLPASDLHPGAYVIVLDGLDNAALATTAPEVARYQFIVQQGEK
jgi:hypothetical protein